MKKGLMRSLRSSIEMSIGEVLAWPSGLEMQQSTIHVTLATTKSGIHPGTVMAQSCFNQFNVTYLP